MISQRLHRAAYLGAGSGCKAEQHKYAQCNELHSLLQQRGKRRVVERVA